MFCNQLSVPMWIILRVDVAFTVLWSFSYYNFDVGINDEFNMLA